MLNGTARFKRFKQLFEYQNLLLLRDIWGQFHEHKLGGKIPPGKICPKFGGKEKFLQVKNSYFMGKK
jgi:hypothetical protein